MFSTRTSFILMYCSVEVTHVPHSETMNGSNFHNVPGPDDYLILHIHTCIHQISLNTHLSHFFHIFHSPSQQPLEVVGNLGCLRSPCAFAWVPKSSTLVSSNSDRPLRAWWRTFMFASHSVLTAVPARIAVEHGAEAVRVAWVRMGSRSMVDLGMEGGGSGKREGIWGWLLAEEAVGTNGLITALNFSAKFSRIDHMHHRDTFVPKANP